MKYIQKYGNILKSELELDLQETGFNYTFTDKNFVGPDRTENAFIQYFNIANQRDYIKRNHPSAKKIIFTLSIFFLICFSALVIISTSITYGSPYEKYFTIGFYGALLLIFIAYKFTGVQKVVRIRETNGLAFVIFNDNQAKTIVEDIVNRRNKYIRNKFIDNNNYKTLSIESVEYFASIGAIDWDEANQIKEKIKSNPVGSVGFDNKGDSA